MVVPSVLQLARCHTLTFTLHSPIRCQAAASRAFAGSVKVAQLGLRARCRQSTPAGWQTRAGRHCPLCRLQKARLFCHLPTPYHPLLNMIFGFQLEHPVGQPPNKMCCHQQSMPHLAKEYVVGLPHRQLEHHIGHPHGGEAWHWHLQLCSGVGGGDVWDSRGLGRVCKMGWGWGIARDQHAAGGSSEDF